MSKFKKWAENARRSYCAHGADLIRSACFVLHINVCVTYRAIILFQRFQEFAENVRRKRGDYSEEQINQNCNGKSESGLNSQEVSFPILGKSEDKLSLKIITPEDLYAPLKECLLYLEENDNIIYMAAACVLISIKLEPPLMSFDKIVNVFSSLNRRRRGEPCIKELQAPEALEEKFRLNILETEEIILQAIGFETFVESSFKYLLIFLQILIEEDNVKVSLENSNNKLISVERLTQTYGNSELKKWLLESVYWLNDVSRLVDLYSEDAHVLALCAIISTMPSYINDLPNDWTLAFGVDKKKIDYVFDLHQTYIRQEECSSKTNIDDLLKNLPFKLNESNLNLDKNRDEETNGFKFSEKSKLEISASLPQLNYSETMSGFSLPAHSILNTNQLEKIPSSSSNIQFAGNDFSQLPPIPISLPGGMSGMMFGNPIPPVSLVPTVPEIPIEQRYQFEDLKDMNPRLGRGASEGREEAEERHARHKRRRRGSSESGGGGDVGTIARGGGGERGGGRHRGGSRRRRHRADSRRREDSRDKGGRRRRQHSLESSSRRDHRRDPTHPRGGDRREEGRQRNNGGRSQRRQR